MKKELLALVLFVLELCLCDAQPGQCTFELPTSTISESMYAKAMNPTLSPSHLEDLPGFTRSVVERDHALITGESQVFFSLPEWKNTQGAYLVTPALGAHFTMYIAQMGAHSSSAPPLPDLERFVFVLGGATRLTTSLEHIELQVNAFAYLPPNTSHSLEASASATVVVFERKYFSKDGATPEVVIGDTEEQPVLETPGEVFVLRKLLPSSHHYDFNVHVMDFQPGEFLNVKEVHYNQHGLLLLEGRGIYRLGNKWYPVQAGDVIWMAPFVPQWYGALGRTKSRYLLYKDVNREPLLHTYSTTYSQ